MLLRGWGMIQLPGSSFTKDMQGEINGIERLAALKFSSRNGNESRVNLFSRVSKSFY